MLTGVPHFRASLLEPPVLHGYGAFPSPHNTLEWHQPVDKWQLLIVSHRGVLSCDGRVLPYGPRAALVFPPRSRCRLERQGLTAYEHIFAWFSLSESPESQVGLPLASDVSRVFDAWEAHWSRAFDRIQFTRTGVVAWLWDVLWHVSSGPENVRKNIYVEAAERIIQERMSEKISVLGLARELEISHSQLVRLFRAEHDTTIQEYIRIQRTMAACRLLTTTTHSVKSIANRVGIPDLHQFSRIIKAATGSSPRQLRFERRSLDIHAVTHAAPGTRQES